ncbi:MAG: hypothetical protein ACLQEQ_01295 [Nitrososphaerales archaeon]
MFSSVLSNVSLGTANTLAYTMLVVVVVFLLSGPVVVYYYRRKMKRMKAASPTGSA